ncbi:GNAT family N-acetyltransferase [Verrucosispora sp. NA02020]|uniref:GNAT family N-acetyltransferase n=1 Tax=Verrucosispora sp. NA02020 TaxID=2742132 RepID=UPI0015904D9B|nr:GNAT family N-acetyltransferase [Verrucosispora sp. NA02020]QKW13408.1 GNAT family N-acetyltransferase [Verrucosispora sp. NA02020]
MVAYSSVARDDALRLFDALQNLYAATYAESPYREGPEQVARFRAGLPDEVTRLGFSLVTANDGALLVGAAYGWTMPTGTWWSRADQDPSPEVLDADKFAVMEWMVHPGHRGQGIGADLMSKLLAGRPEKYATLASNPASAARLMYERAGWQQAATSVLPWGPTMDLLVLPLRGSAT